MALSRMRDLMPQQHRQLRFVADAAQDRGMKEDIPQSTEPFTTIRSLPHRRIMAETPVSQLDQLLPDRWKAARVVNPPASA